MADTLLLDQASWDLVLDADNNIAVASAPYALAQDAASAIKTFAGECFWNTTVGVPYLERILGRRPPIALLKESLIGAALTVPEVVSAQVFITGLDSRSLAGQVHVVSTTGELSFAAFHVINPQTGA